MKNYFYYNSPIGDLTLCEEDGFLTELSFGLKIGINNFKESEVIKRTCCELDEYFQGKRKEFTIPLKPEGTTFQKKVWKALQTIPYGKTCSYKEIAILADSPKGFRAVGLANNKNPIAILIPCHRVIGSDGKLVGYGGGIEKKIFLLELEKSL